MMHMYFRHGHFGERLQAVEVILVVEVGGVGAHQQFNGQAIHHSLFIIKTRQTAGYTARRSPSGLLAAAGDATVHPNPCMRKLKWGFVRRVRIDVRSFLGRLFYCIHIYLRWYQLALPLDSLWYPLPLMLKLNPPLLLLACRGLPALLLCP